MNIWMNARRTFRNEETDTQENIILTNILVLYQSFAFEILRHYVHRESDHIMSIFTWKFPNRRSAFSSLIWTIAELVREWECDVLTINNNLEPKCAWIGNFAIYFNLASS